MNLNVLVRKNILQLTPYSSARSEFKGQAEIFLDANENPFETGFNRYPDPLQWKLKERISELKNIPVEQIFLGNGSDEAIDLVVRIFCEPRLDHIITLPPTYGMYQVSADIADVEVVSVPLTANFQPDVESILANTNVHSKLLFICTPNNPTGNDVTLSTVRELAERFPGIVVVDEAYTDFSEQASCITLLPEYPNLIVFQTFSKAWGLAGLRLGMAFSSKEIIALFNKVKPPYNLNQLTQQTALRILNEDVAKKDEMVRTLLSERTKLTEALQQLPFISKIHPSNANFILVQIDDANGWYQYLVEKGIIVRSRANVRLIEGSLRITVGRPAENEALINAFRKDSKPK
jgi:histidinol-phosphate aminotransferase